MSKWLLIALAIVVIGIIGFYTLNNYVYNAKQGDTNSPNTMQNSGNPNTSSVTENGITVTPISHATMVLNMADQVVYVDPVGGVDAFAGQPDANVILVTDIHGDHLEVDTLRAVTKENTVVIAPQAVADELPDDFPGTITVMNNGETISQSGIVIEAIPMYNVPEAADAFHTKGRGNGYILEANETRVYIAGDTAGTPEMRALTDIDIAFVPMNLPYTMSVEDAADAVLTFKPKVVHPYHYRGQDGLADINTFKELVNNGDANIDVQLLDFYPNE